MPLFKVKVNFDISLHGFAIHKKYIEDKIVFFFLKGIKKRKKVN